MSKQFPPFALITLVSIRASSSNGGHTKKKRAQEHIVPKVGGEIVLQLLSRPCILQCISPFPLTLKM